MFYIYSSKAFLFSLNYFLPFDTCFGNPNSELISSEFLFGCGGMKPQPWFEERKPDEAPAFAD